MKKNKGNINRKICQKRKLLQSPPMRLVCAVAQFDLLIFGVNPMLQVR